MPTFRILRGATAYNISYGQVIYIEDIDDLGGAGVRNLEESGPYQHGVSHLGYRLEPTVVTLRLFVRASTAALLDGYRDTLNAMFKPIDGVPITLEVTRDDGEVRLLDTERFGRLGIRLRPEDGPGHLHRAVVQLRAGDPTWYNADEETATFVTPVAEWWLAYATIGTANVLEHVTSPTQGQAWATSGSVAPGSPWTVVFRSGLETPGTALKYAFEFNDETNTANFNAWSSWSGGYFAQSGGAAGTAGGHMTAGTYDYFMVNNGGTLTVYRDTTLLFTSVGQGAGIQASTKKRWRSTHGSANFWVEALPYAAAYNIALDAVQRQALSDAINTGSAFSKSIAYEGDWESYPVLSIQGPITNPIITNAATGDVLNFTGGTVGSADIWTIDTRYGRKSIINLAGSSVVNYLSNDSDLATFRFVPDPLIAGGTNTVSVSGSATGTATAISISYLNRYLDY